MDLGHQTLDLGRLSMDAATPTALSRWRCREAATGSRKGSALGSESTGAGRAHGRKVTTRAGGERETGASGRRAGGRRRA